MNNKKTTIYCDGTKAVSEYPGTAALNSWFNVYLPAPSDDAYVLNGKDLVVTASTQYPASREGWVRLRRKDCTGAPDSDSDGFDDCAEFDANTEWDDHSSQPPADLDTDGDRVPDPQDWCPRERPELLLLGAPPVFDDPEGDGCPKGRGPYQISVVPTDWRGPYRFDARASTAFPYAASATYAWSFGTGTVTGTGKAAATAHWMYRDAGSYPISVTVSDPSGRRVTVTSSEPFTLSGNASPQPFTVTGNPLVDFAPEVRLDGREEIFPMLPGEFLRHSTLYYREPGPSPLPGGCGLEDTVVASPPDAARMGDGPANTRYSFFFDACSQPGDGVFVRSDERSRPPDMPDGIGFFLDFDTNHLPTDFQPAPVWTESGPHGEELTVTYWFFYGDNDAPGGAIGGALDDHEGDWEQINLNLDPELKVPRSLVYFAHGGGDAPRAFTDPDVEKSNWLHPVVYSAVGSHASYSSVSETHLIRTLPNGFNDIVFDRANGEGPVWQTWKTGVFDATRQGWYGFGGAWGAVGSSTHTSGPMGPGQWKPRF